MINGDGTTNGNAGDCRLIPRNGDRAWNSMADAVERIEQHITGQEGLFVRMDRVERELANRPCEEHERLIRENNEALKNRLNWKAMLVALVPALVAGALLGLQFRKLLTIPVGGA